MVACISNGTAVLGLGNIGALASKPVMEGKSVLFKKFADVNCVDLCIDMQDKDEFVNIVKYLHCSFGGINLEDIKGPDCFYVEEKLKELMPIPVFHDDQHGTAIVCLAGLINALDSANKNIEDVKVIVNGAGAAGIACMKLIINYGAKPENCFVLDTKGVIYPGRA
jgi:malate dehydrogenase (oxaloacetate-decarboxylating)(NADP+)